MSGKTGKRAKRPAPCHRCGKRISGAFMRCHDGDYHDECLRIVRKYEVYRVDDPVEALGMPRDHKWAVSKNQGFLDSFKTKKEAKEFVNHMAKGE